MKRLSVIALEKSWGPHTCVVLTASPGSPATGSITQGMSKNFSPAFCRCVEMGAEAGLGRWEGEGPRCQGGHSSGMAGERWEVLEKGHRGFGNGCDFKCCFSQTVSSAALFRKMDLFVPSNGQDSIYFGGILKTGMSFILKICWLHPPCLQNALPGLGSRSVLAPLGIACHSALPINVIRASDLSFLLGMISTSLQELRRMLFQNT